MRPSFAAALPWLKPHGGGSHVGEVLCVRRCNDGTTYGRRLKEQEDEGAVARKHKRHDAQHLGHGRSVVFATNCFFLIQVMDHVGSNTAARGVPATETMET